MNLKNCTRVSHPDGCFACKWAGRDIAIWPQYEELTNKWFIYYSVNEFVQGLRSSHKSTYFCQEHANHVKETWVEIAMDEVWLDHLWNQHIERTEK